MSVLGGAAEPEPRSQLLTVAPEAESNADIYRDTYFFMLVTARPSNTEAEKRMKVSKVSASRMQRRG